MEDIPQFSLPVPHVQALAASLHGANDIPERYIRPEAEAEPVAVDDEAVRLPVIDLGQAQLSPEECAKLGLACEEWGFFQDIGLSTFRDTMDAYTSELKEVANCLLRLLAENLGVEPEIITNNFKDMRQIIRANYYPPCPKADKVFGLSPHSDATGLTILLQVSDVEGLQIRNNGVWFPVKPLPGAFIVNVGDFLEIFSNGKYKSIEHRAIVNTEKERLTLATFHGPDENCIVRPLPQLVKGGAENYMASTYEDFMKGYFSKKLDGKSHLERVKLRD